MNEICRRSSSNCMYVFFFFNYLQPNFKLFSLIAGGNPEGEGGETEVEDYSTYSDYNDVAEGVSNGWVEISMSFRAQNTFAKKKRSFDISGRGTSNYRFFHLKRDQDALRKIIVGHTHAISFISPKSLFFRREKLAPAIPGPRSGDRWTTLRSGWARREFSVGSSSLQG